MSSTATTSPEGDSDHHVHSREYGGGGEAAGAVMADVLSKGREACYKARDAFYTCVEKHADKKPTEIATMGAPLPRRLQEVPRQLRQQLPPILGEALRPAVLRQEAGAAAARRRRRPPGPHIAPPAVHVQAIGS